MYKKYTLKVKLHFLCTSHFSILHNTTHLSPPFVASFFHISFFLYLHVVVWYKYQPVPRSSVEFLRLIIPEKLPQNYVRRSRLREVAAFLVNVHSINTCHSTSLSSRRDCQWIWLVQVSTPAPHEHSYGELGNSLERIGNASRIQRRPLISFSPFLRLFPRHRRCRCTSYASHTPFTTCRNFFMQLVQPLAAVQLTRTAWKLDRDAHTHIKALCVVGSPKSPLLRIFFFRLDRCVDTKVFT